MKHRALILLLLAAMALTLAAPASALLFSDDSGEVSVAAFSKNGAIHDPFTFSAGDFVVTGDAELSAVVIQSLPAAGAGLLKLGDAELKVGDTVAAAALSGMRFYPLSSPTVASTSFQVAPIFDDGLTGEAVPISLYLLAKENAAPIAENVEIKTYKNVAVTGQLSAVDPEGDMVTFRLVSTPARGEVELSEDGSGTFVYTPYENKKGKDSFTYVAEDSVGNVSAEATVKITISKAGTKVTYSDMEGHAAHCAAIRLAEEEIFVGAQVDGSYFFQPELAVTRAEFLTMAMSAAGLESLEGISVTGFADDEAIPAWAKGYVSSAVQAGVVTGIAGEDGLTFRTGDAITKAEAAVILDRLLNVTDVAVDALAESVPVWAGQSVANMAAVDVLSDLEAMDQTVTRAQAAQLLSGLLDVLENREKGWV